MPWFYVQWILLLIILAYLPDLMVHLGTYPLVVAGYLSVNIMMMLVLRNTKVRYVSSLYTKGCMLFLRNQGRVYVNSP